MSRRQRSGESAKVVAALVLFALIGIGIVFGVDEWLGRLIFAPMTGG